MDVELTQYEVLAKEILRRVIAEEEPADLHQWLQDQLSRMGGGDETAVMTWEESFDLVDRMLKDYAAMANTPPNERVLLDWPWATWNNIIEPLEPGILAVISAPDGQGKTIYAESISEYWASHKHRVVFVHYELNRRLMMLRRTARHTSIDVRTLKSGRLDATQLEKVTSTRPRLLSWDGRITYLHTPGWTMERTIADLRRLKSEGLCDVVVLDYLEKAAASRRQLSLFGSNGFMREADNVEQIKVFAESSEIPVLMVTQFSKVDKGKEINKIDRSSMRGAGEKSEKANLVILLSRKRIDEGYSKEIDVLVDKNTMGATGTFKQLMQPEYFRVGDIYNAQRIGG
jgi:replicative DNA helicase